MHLMRFRACMPEFGKLPYKYILRDQCSSLFAVKTKKFSFFLLPSRKTPIISPPPFGNLGFLGDWELSPLNKAGVGVNTKSKEREQWLKKLLVLLN